MNVRMTIASVAVAVGIVATGCRPPTASSPASQPSDSAVQVALHSPEEATRSLFQLLQAQLAATARHDWPAAQRVRDQAVREIVAREDVMTRYRAVAGRTPREEPEALSRLVESWAAMISYYADSLALDRVRIAASSAEQDRVITEVPADGRAGGTVLQVGCVRDEHGQWRISGLDFALPSAAGPSTSPSHSSSNAGPTTVAVPSAEPPPTSLPAPN